MWHYEVTAEQKEGVKYRNIVIWIHDRQTYEGTQKEHIFSTSYPDRISYRTTSPRYPPWKYIHT